MPRKRASRSQTRSGCKFARKLSLEVLEDRRLLAVDFSLLKDINVHGPGSNPGNFVEVGAVLFFTANDGVTGFGIWKSDGTEAGTVRVKDFQNDLYGFYPLNLTNVGGTLYFVANDGTSGAELWKSDGTEAGTVRVKDIRSGSLTSDPRNLTNVGGTLYFTAYDGTSGVELWKSDGTEAGTVRVKDIREGTYSSNPSNLTNVGGTLYFAADDGRGGVELWKSDGTEAGTVLVKDFNGDSTSSSLSNITEANGRLYVVATTAQYGSEIWVADLNPPAHFGDYNTNGRVDAADYVVWRKTLGSTTNLQANGDNTGASAGVIDQGDYAVWRSNFEEGAGGLGLGAAVEASSEARAASGEELRIADFGLEIENVGQVAVTSSVVATENAVASMVGDSPSPRPSPGGRGGIGAATGGRGGIASSAVVGEPDSLLLMATGALNERSAVEDEVATKFAEGGQASALADELAALDVAFAGVGQSGIEGVRR